LRQQCCEANTNQKELKIISRSFYRRIKENSNSVASSYVASTASLVKQLFLTLARLDGKTFGQPLLMAV
jgi:hypothetical protein